ncbi:hypothetical protein [Alienimonas californiensis]|uniref:Nickel uptake substrate-specific transmembrane region n=1 Tax=Alienimonas californiensis TaxID=2527989 RepID=A0A517PA93_9PLAN|nr:hypothetical protein [Alienimonas californiensis]QDT16285.1 hypothetical protein CA12_23860 [Alienimonas californiensis]
MKTFVLSTAAGLLLAAGASAQGPASHDHVGHDHAGHDHDGHDHAGDERPRLIGADFAADDHAGHEHAGLVADEHAGHRHGPHGGEVDSFPEVRVETLIDRDGLRFWLTDPAGRPLASRGLGGQAVMRVEGAEKRYSYDLAPPAAPTVRDREAPGVRSGEADAATLAVPLALSKVAGRRVAVAVRLTGVSGTGADGVIVRQIARIPAPSGLEAPAIQTLRPVR